MVKEIFAPLEHKPNPYTMSDKLIFKPHPWHGVPVGKGAPGILTAFIEMVPTDTCKYEIDKHTGYLKIDRPQKFSNIIPALYGFIPQTYCGKKTAEFSGKKSGRKLTGDGDPLDICVFTERETTVYVAPFLIIIEIALITWGLIEIFDRAKKCEGLMYSDLWIYAIICNVLQMIYLIIITIATVMIITPKRNQINPVEV